jgi:transposase
MTAWQTQISLETFMYRNAKQWHRIRRSILENGVPKKRISRETGISRKTINKMLTHKDPPRYAPRRRDYPKLGPYIPRINQLLFEKGPVPTSTKIIVQDIVHLLRQEDGFTGSYDSVRNYIRHVTHPDDAAWERAYNTIIQLPKFRAIEFIKILSRDNSPALTSSQVKLLAQEASCSLELTCYPNRDEQRLIDVEWMRQLLQNDVDEAALRRELDDIPELSVLLRHLHNGRLSDRNRSLAVLASHRKISSKTICAFLGVGKAFVRKCRNKFGSMGATIFFAPQTKSNRKFDNEKLRAAVFKMLHEPPAEHRINRTSWTLALLCKTLKENGTPVGISVVAKMIKSAGYKWRKAKIVLTSNDPAYSEKLARIRSILSNLPPGDAFFSIDEFGPFAIKMKPGRMLVPPGFQPTVPQWQKSRGCLIMTAALELSSNQVTHFYSAKKNTDEMIRMMEALIAKYPGRRNLYLSWDAASWHISKRLFTRIEAHNATATKEGGPLIETVPLPASAQFLNVIESIFSGMARAIIHNSNYKSIDEAKAAIDLYFENRNGQFQQNPKRAGKKIWGQEREAAEFSDANNCKNPRYR